MRHVRSAAVKAETFAKVILHVIILHLSKYLSAKEHIENT